jgi:hypothetical protein
MPTFIPGLKLSQLYYEEIVRPILQAEYPALAYSAGLIGPGSEVLGFDTEMSRDHDWGPGMMLFLPEEDLEGWEKKISETLAYHLPFTFYGYPTNFEAAPDDPGTVIIKPTNQHPVHHKIRITSLRSFLREHAGLDPQQEMRLVDWLTTPEQILCTLTAGAVFYDGLNILEPLRRKLAYYPHELWLYLLSAQWQRIGQEEPFVGRTGSVGDDIGSAIIAARLVRDVMRLCFLLEKRYAPYSKWFGTAFARLDCAARLSPILENVLAARRWQEREKSLCAAYEIAAAMHNELGLTPPVAGKVSRFFNRPFWVIQADKLAELVWETIQDEEVRKLPFGVGKVDQFIDSTDILSSAQSWRKFADLFQ